ncbi:MAG: chemotaxis protein CheD [Candidatus Tectomicrobia bacterium]|uniref:Probable chemoreceptor glutamine deamidase CheD n=1 Tax=Tectimicrobiota bacterium TaxID=2528274 RepID=A0A932CLT9_UNCTE|nr:chemotaxis protein CheD [Candidatus Tectomicrobia bacterium]
MAEKALIAGLGELRVSRDPQVILVAYGLGSCVGVCAYDPVSRVAGLLHAMLPESNGFPQSNPAKFVSTGIPSLLEEMIRQGASCQRLVFKVAGGARMLDLPGFNRIFDVGARNVATTLEILKQKGLRLTASDIGGTAGRTVRLFVETGRVMVKTLGQEKEL